MNEEAFVNRRDVEWRRLQTLCAKADNSIRNLTGDELREMVQLYRRVSTDLAAARTKSTNQGLIDYLNDLTAHAYAVLYRSARPPLYKMALDALVTAAETVRRRRAFVLTSVAIFFAAALFSFAILKIMPETRTVLLSPDMERSFEGWRSGKFEERDSSTSLAMSAFYASNNPRVAIIAGAVGAGSFGFLSVLLNWQNGALLGVLAHEVDTVGHLDFLLSSIAPHGVPELSGIWIACAAGLLLGSALINPGRRSRGDALRAVGKDAIVLLVISVVLMFIAAPIEGFFSFNPSVPGAAKITVAVVEIVGWISFWVFFGKKPDPEAAPTGPLPSAPSTLPTG